MKATRMMLIFIVGGLLIYLTYKSKYQNFFFDALVWFFLLIVGLVLLVWTVIRDIKSYKVEKRVKAFLPTGIAVCFIVTILILDYKISAEFNKISLLKVYYDGDFNGTGIDFKKDGTYIFHNSAIGLSNYQYGTYKIRQDTITLDRRQLDNVISCQYLVIRKKEIRATAGINYETFLSQMAKDGRVIEEATEFRVIVDSRRK